MERLESFCLAAGHDTIPKTCDQDVDPRVPGIVEIHGDSSFATGWRREGVVLEDGAMRQEVP